MIDPANTQWPTHLQPGMISTLGCCSCIHGASKTSIQQELCPCISPVGCWLPVAVQKLHLLCRRFGRQGALGLLGCAGRLATSPGCQRRRERVCGGGDIRDGQQRGVPGALPKHLSCTRSLHFSSLDFHLAHVSIPPRPSWLVIDPLIKAEEASSRGQDRILAVGCL